VGNLGKQISELENKVGLNFRATCADAQKGPHFGQRTKSDLVSAQLAHMSGIRASAHFIEIVEHGDFPPGTEPLEI